MILPSKHLGRDRALLTIGGEVLGILNEPKTVSRVWDELKSEKARKTAKSPIITFDWFVLALDLLFLLNAIEMDQGRLRRGRVGATALEPPGSNAIEMDQGRLRRVRG